MKAIIRTALRPFHRLAQIFILLALALVTYFGVRLWLDSEPAVHALPEFTDRTGEPCASCHVNPGGGGPRTLRGLLWAARGRPETVPELPGAAVLPTITDGLELYDISCAGCHGRNGEGLFAIGLAEREISPAAARSFIRDGIPEYGMPAFGDQLTDEQLEALTEFVAELSAGPPLPEEFPLPAPQFTCAPVTPILCGGEQAP